MARPRIGINCDVATPESGTEIAKVNWAYVAAVVRAGGAPVLFPSVDPALVPDMLGAVDGVVLTGGRDYDPALYGEACHPATKLLDARRTAFDVALARAAIEQGLPVLGICGGAQLINVAGGGSLVQHVPDVAGEAFTHEWRGGAEPFHEVEVDAGSLLRRIVGADRLRVNSSHHQAAARVGEGLRVVAHAPDGVTEGIEAAGPAFVLGVQWHPERMPDAAEQRALFRELVAVARERAAQR